MCSSDSDSDCDNFNILDSKVKQRLEKQQSDIWKGKMQVVQERFKRKINTYKKEHGIEMARIRQENSDLKAKLLETQTELERLRELNLKFQERLFEEVKIVLCLLLLIFLDKHITL